jgi:hypothetical protein
MLTGIKYVSFFSVISVRKQLRSNKCLARYGRDAPRNERSPSCELSDVITRFHKVLKIRVNSLNTQFLHNFIYTVRTSQKTHSAPITKPNRLMLLTETVAVYRENHSGPINAVYGPNAELKCLKEGRTYTNHWALKC